MLNKNGVLHKALAPKYSAGLLQNVNLRGVTVVWFIVWLINASHLNAGSRRDVGTTAIYIAAH